MEALTLLRPWWLLALPLVAGFAWWLRSRQGGIGDWARVIDPDLMAALARLGQVDRGAGRWPARAALILALLTVLALAGPALERRDAVAFRNLDGVVLVLDASPSVAESPRWPQLLTMGRFGVAALGARPAALVLYAGDAYVATDMTGDLRQLGQTLSLVGPDTVPDPGTRPERGLALAARILEESRVLAGDVVLMTDGAGLGAETLAQAEALAARDARLSVIALDTPGPEIAAHAEIGGGRVFTLDQTDALAGFLSREARAQLERQDYPLLFWADYGRWLLALALLPALLLFRRRAA